MYIHHRSILNINICSMRLWLKPNVLFIPSFPKKYMINNESSYLYEKEPVHNSVFNKLYRNVM